MSSSHPRLILTALPRRTALPRLLAQLAPGALLLSAVVPALAQVPPPPLPPSEEESAALDSTPAPVSESGSPATEGTSATSTDAPSAQPTSEPVPAESSTEAPPSDEAASTISGQEEQQVDLSAEPLAAQEDAEAPDSEESAAWFRLDSTRRQPTLGGSTGLYRVREAGSGAPGTFRLQLMGGYYSGKHFLCNENFPCFDPVTGEPSMEDKAQRSLAIFNLSVTPFSFLEAFFTLSNSATYNSQGHPQSLQVVGDMNLGVKGFMPHKPDQIFTAGGEADLYLLTGTGGVGLAGPATSFALRALASVDFNNRTDPDKRFPLRAHVNLGYFFDNSAQVIADLEEAPPPEGRGGERISRIERYGLGISRVDAFQIGLGTEYIHPYIRPFIEWTLDIPVNRQGYECVITDTVNDRTTSADQCLKLAGGLATSPSRLSFGARVFPWQATGLAVNLGMDVGTGGVHRFLDETRPETPYTLWFGLGYTVDVVPKAPKEVEAAKVADLTPEVRRYVTGRVVEEASGSPVPNAIIHYKDVPMTGLIANNDGLFITQDLPPGEYVFDVRAEGHKDGVCVATIPETAPGLEPTATSSAEPTTPEATPDEAPAEAPAEGEQDPAQALVEPTAPFSDQDGNILVPLDCKLAELPPVANITGLLVDGRNGGPVRDASVTIVDKLDRSLSLEVDDAGAFQFRNVPFGEARIRATAPGYLPTIHPINVATREEIKPHVLMNPRPQKLGVTFTKTEVKLNREIEFVGDTTDMILDSAAMLEELAVALMEKPDVGTIEIQVHTDDSGAANYARTMSQERADRIRTSLIDLGVLPRVLEAKGYGPDQPLTPNVSEESRAKNNRVQFILKKE